MPVLPADCEEYRAFALAQIRDLGCLDFNREQILWHYTTGDSLIKIVESGTLLGTHVSCLNDSAEIRYGSELLRSAFGRVREEQSLGIEKDNLVKRIMARLENLGAPTQLVTSWYVICFSELADDLSQWRAYCGGENGYAIGFSAEDFGVNGHNGPLIRVNYDSSVHASVVTKVAHATVRFFQAGLEQKRAESVEQWTQEFLPAWGDEMEPLAPMLKHPAFSCEREFRVVKEVGSSEAKMFQQKTALMSRHVRMSFPPGQISNPKLPIVKVMVGPSRHKEISHVSVEALLRENGYASCEVSVSSILFQHT